MSWRQPCIPGAPFGPVAARTRRRTSAGADQRHLLRHEAADREPKQIDLRQVERTDERDHRPRRVGNRRAELAARRTDTRIVDEDHTALARQCVGERRIPVVEVAAEVLEHDQRCGARSAEAAERKAHLTRVDELRHRG
jgi:hypothetical protein